MNAVLVWFLVTAPGINDHVVYSPPMPDQATCEFLQKSIPNKYLEGHSRCVQIKIMVAK